MNISYHYLKFQKGKLNPQGTSFKRKLTIKIIIIEQNTRLRAKVENTFGNKIQLCFLYCSHPDFFQQDSLSFKQIFKAKTGHAIPQNMINPTIFPEHRTNELQIKIYPKQFGFLLYLKNPVDISPKLIINYLFSFLMSMSFDNQIPSSKLSLLCKVLSRRLFFKLMDLRSHNLLLKDKRQSNSQPKIQTPKCRIQQRPFAQICHLEK